MTVSSETISLCPLCNKVKKLLGHHLSYEPEIVINICEACHIEFHNMVRLYKTDRFNKYIEWIKQYGDTQWDDGKAKYLRSSYSKTARNRWVNSERGKSWRKEYAQKEENKVKVRENAKKYYWAHLEDERKRSREYAKEYRKRPHVKERLSKYYKSEKYRLQNKLKNKAFRNAKSLKGEGK